jgi:hypothetical protein
MGSFRMAGTLIGDCGWRRVEEATLTNDPDGEGFYPKRRAARHGFASTTIVSLKDALSICQA